MMNIQQILQEAGLTDEAMVKTIVEGVNTNYRTISETESKKARIAELEAQLEEYAGRIASLEGDSEQVQELRDKVAAFEKAEKERIEREAEIERAASFAKVFDQAVENRPASAGNRFANEYAREGILAKVREMCEGNPAVSVSDAIDSVTKDVTGIWVNPQKDPAKMPSGDGAQSDKSKEAAARTIIDFMRG